VGETNQMKTKMSDNTELLLVLSGAAAVCAVVMLIVTILCAVFWEVAPIIAVLTYLTAALFLLSTAIAVGFGLMAAIMWWFDRPSARNGVKREEPSNH